MFTGIDKALVALVMAIIYILNTFFGFNLGINEMTLNTIIAIITPILVYLVPNKKTS